MTHWSNITPSTREFTDSSYKRLPTPSEFLWTEKQKAEMETKRKKKEKDEKTR